MRYTMASYVKYLFMNLSMQNKAYFHLKKIIFIETVKIITKYSM